MWLYVARNDITFKIYHTIERSIVALLVAISVNKTKGKYKENMLYNKRKWDSQELLRNKNKSLKKPS